MPHGGADDWKGEHLIKINPTQKERKAERQRIISTVYHEERRKVSLPTPAAAKHGKFMMGVFNSRGIK